MRITIEIPVTPTSFNATRTAHWRTVKRHHDHLRDELLVAIYQLDAIPPPPGTKIHATAVLRFPKKRKRDEGNFRAPLEKALGDALQHKRWIADDTPDHFTFGEVTFDPEPGPSRTTITMEVS